MKFCERFIKYMIKIEIEEGVNNYLDKRNKKSDQLMKYST